MLKLKIKKSLKRLKIKIQNRVNYKFGDLKGLNLFNPDYEIDIDYNFSFR